MPYRCRRQQSHLIRLLFSALKLPSSSFSCIDALLLLHEALTIVHGLRLLLNTIDSSKLTVSSSDWGRLTSTLLQRRNSQSRLCLSPCLPSHQQSIIPRAKEFGSPPVRHVQTRPEPPKPSDGRLSRSVEARQLKFLPRPLFPTASTLHSRISPMLLQRFRASSVATTLFSKKLMRRRGLSRKICCNYSSSPPSRSPSLILPTQRLLSGV